MPFGVLAAVAGAAIAAHQSAVEAGDAEKAARVAKAMETLANGLEQALDERAAARLRAIARAQAELWCSRHLGPALLSIERPYWPWMVIGSLCWIGWAL